ncbi:MAG: phosphotransferase [Patescibacteria group bacterium]
MKHASKSELENINNITSFFDIGLSGKITVITEGIGNYNYLVITSQGDYVVKFLVTQKPLGIENDIAIQNQLASVDIKTSTYIKNKNGQYLYSDKDVNAVVSQKIDGVVPRRASKGLAFEIGRTLAVFHKHVTALPHPINGWMNPDMIDIHSEEAIILFTKSLPKGITHGDMHLGNVLVNPKEPDNIYAILDFEEAGDDLFVVDLARSILGVCYSEDENSLAIELVKAEINGYESVRKLHEDEKMLLPEAIKYATDACIKWFRENGYERYVEKHRRRANSFRMPV